MKYSEIIPEKVFSKLIFYIINPVPCRDYQNGPKFSDRNVWANSADPDQTAPRGAAWSGSTLFAIPSALFGHITQQQSTLFNF